MGNIKKIISLFIAVFLIFGCLSIGFTVDADALEIQYARSYTQNQSHMFSKEFTLTGNYADDLVAVAQAQIGKTTSELMYAEDWCADFANDTARLTGMPDSIVPYNYGLRASCGFMYQYMINNCNAKVIEDVNDVRTGDYVFYYCPSSNFYLHVGIVESPEAYIEGNYSSKVCRLGFNYTFNCYIHGGITNTTDSGHVKRIYVRPNYPDPPKKNYTSTNPDTYSAPKRLLKYKEPVTSCGYDVSWTQAVLYKLGYLKAVTGEYNKQTVSAVKKFQSDNLLEASGEVDGKTAEALKTAWEDVKYPSCLNFKSNKQVYNYYDTVSISAEIKNADSYNLVIKDSRGNLVKEFANTSICKFLAKELGSGAYTAAFTLKNSYTSLLSKSISFTVEKPVPTAPKLTVSHGTSYEAAVFSWAAAQHATSYDLHIKKAKSNSDYLVKKNLTANEYSVLLPKGNYTAYVVSKNDYSSTTGEKINFSVTNGSPVDLGSSLYARFNLSGSINLSLTGNGSISSLQTSNGSLSQAWYIVKASQNTYTIKNCGNGKNLTLASNGSVVLSEENRSSYQRWYFAKGKDSYFLVPSINAPMVISANDSNLTVKTSFDGSYEAFKLTKITPVHNYEITELIAPDCTENGRVHYLCSVCGEEFEKTILSDGHCYVEQKISENHSIFTCKYCGDSYETGLPKEDNSIEPTDTADTPNNSTEHDSNGAIVPDTLKTTSVIIGDADGDGKLTANDVIIISRAAVGLEKLSDMGMIVADVDFDGKITSADSLYALRKLVHLHSDSKAGDVVLVRTDSNYLRLKQENNNYYPSLKDSEAY